MNSSGLSFVPAYKIYKSQALHVHNDMGDVLILTSHVVYFLWILMDVKLMAPVAKWTTLLVLVVPWSYYPFNWPYMGITGFITAINGLTRLLTKLVGAHFCGIFQH